MSTRRATVRPPAAAARRAALGFSLVEVLMAVFILALGLLGLGAVFPVVIREQRQSNDLVAGTVAANSAKALLEGLDYTAVTTFTAMRNSREFWLRMRDDRTLLDRQEYYNGKWFLPDMTPDSGDPVGTIVLGGAGASGSDSTKLKISTAARLWPTGTPLDVPPQFVWDCAVQRIPDGDGDPLNDGVRVAIFVRRIDTRIRVNPQYGLYRQIVGHSGPLQVPAADRRVPVAVDQDGMPTLDGVGEPALNYAQLRTVLVRFRFDASRPELRARDRLYFDTRDPEGSSPANNVPWRLASRPGQKLVDNLGNIYTVVETGRDTSGDYVRVTPPVPAHIPETPAGISDTNDLVCIRQVLLSPQIPAAVTLWSAIQ